jgi:hypothetical protein
MGLLAHSAVINRTEPLALEVERQPAVALDGRGTRDAEVLEALLPPGERSARRRRMAVRVMLCVPLCSRSAGQSKKVMSVPGEPHPSA